MYGRPRKFHSSNRLGCRANRNFEIYNVFWLVFTVTYNMQKCGNLCFFLVFNPILSYAGWVEIWIMFVAYIPNTYTDKCYATYFYSGHYFCGYRTGSWTKYSNFNKKIFQILCSMVGNKIHKLIHSLKMSFIGKTRNSMPTKTIDSAVKDHTDIFPVSLYLHSLYSWLLIHYL